MQLIFHHKILSNDTQHGAVHTYRNRKEDLLFHFIGLMHTPHSLSLFRLICCNSHMSPCQPVPGTYFPIYRRHTTSTRASVLSCRVPDTPGTHSTERRTNYAVCYLILPVRVCVCFCVRNSLYAYGKFARFFTALWRHVFHERRPPTRIKLAMKRYEAG